jgi:hypothetical protein
MERKILLVFVVVLYSVTCTKAQIGRGSTFLGGNLGFSTSENFDRKQTVFLISPSVGITVKENFILGTSLRYGHLKNEHNNVKGKDYGIGIFARKYKPLGKGFYLFGHSELGYTYNYQDQVVFISQSTDTHREKIQSIRLNLNPGLSYAISNRLQVELMFSDFISATYSRFKKESLKNQHLIEPKSNSFSVNSNLSINGINSLEIGIRIFLNKSR